MWLLGGMWIPFFPGEGDNLIRDCLGIPSLRNTFVTTVWSAAIR